MQRVLIQPIESGLNVSVRKARRKQCRLIIWFRIRQVFKNYAYVGNTVLRYIRFYISTPDVGQLHFGCFSLFDCDVSLSHFLILGGCESDCCIFDANFTWNWFKCCSSDFFLYWLLVYPFSNVNYRFLAEIGNKSTHFVMCSTFPHPFPIEMGYVSIHTILLFYYFVRRFH